MNYIGKGFYTLNIFTHNIPIKRYCDIWQFLATDFYWTTKVSSYQNIVYLVLSFDKSLPWLVIETHGSKLWIYFYLFISILCAKMSIVYRALKRKNVAKILKGNCQEGRQWRSRFFLDVIHGLDIKYLLTGRRSDEDRDVIGADFTNILQTEH